MLALPPVTFEPHADNALMVPTQACKAVFFLKPESAGSTLLPLQLEITSKLSTMLS